MSNIFIDGSGLIADPDSKKLETIKFRAPIQYAEVTLLPAEILHNNGLHPKFLVKEVRLEVEMQNTIVSAFGHVPLFKTKKFEESVKNWIKQET